MNLRSLGMRLGFSAACMMMACAPCQGQEAPPEAEKILGIWVTADGKAHIEIFRSGELYSGRIVWLRDSLKNGTPAVDDKNPDAHLKGRPIQGMELMYGFSYDGDDEWDGGRVYDPESGNEYRGKLRLTDESTLDLRGYIMIPLFGRSETWRRLQH
jgi:uncharacterized protein (DUF2147 family)